MKAKSLFFQTLKLHQDKYLVELNVYQVAKSTKYPDGIKAKYVLIDLEKNAPRLLVDNHEPFGFHMHTDLPENHQVRVSLNVQDYREARDIFFDEVERILHESEE
jgi:hypothetical protein